MRPRVKLWFEYGGGRVMGDGIARLLDGVRGHGSLRAAAQAMGMSYRHAWGLLRAVEERLGEPLLRRKAGGDAGGGSVLTPAGARLLDQFLTLRAALEEEAERRFRRLQQGSGPAGPEPEE